MFPYYIRAGQADASINLRAYDSTTFLPLTSLVYNSAGISASYRREGATNTTITLATLAALTTAHADGGFLHIGNGYYRLDSPDAAFAAGVAGVLFHMTATGAIFSGVYAHLNLENAADVADAVLDEALSGHTTAGTPGKKLGDMTFTTANLVDVRVNNVSGVTLQEQGVGSKRIGGTS